MKNQDIVDIGVDGTNRRENLRRRVFRVATPIGFVIVILAALLAITTYSYQSNRRDALALSGDLLKAIERRVARELEAFLIPIEDTVQLTADVLQNTSFDTKNRALLEPLAFRVLANLPQISIFNVADTEGNFLMVKEMPDESLHTKLIDRTEHTAQVTWIRRDKSGKTVAVETSMDDSYDPRNRPWYVGAVRSRQVFWSDFYIFFTDQNYGITVSIPVVGRDNKLLGVLGLDIGIETISAFLETLRIGQQGRAIIIDEEGYLVAHPEISKMVKKEGEAYRRIRFDELNDPLLHRAYNRFQIEGHGHRDLLINNKRYLTTAFPLPTKTGHDLTVFVLVPEQDFVGFVSRNNRTALLMSLSIVALAAIMAGLMVFQGLRADRNAQLVLNHQRNLRDQSRAFSELASKTALFDPTDTESFGQLTQTVTKAIRIRRTSVWSFDEDGELLTCRDCFDGESNGHTRGTALAKSDFHEFFELLQKGEDIRVEHAGKDSRLGDLYRVYLEPLGCDSLLMLPIRNHVETVGSLWFEHEGPARRWSAEEVSFAHAIANMLALRFSADRKSASAHTKTKEDTDISDDYVGQTMEATSAVRTTQPSGHPDKQHPVCEHETHVSVLGEDRLPSSPEGPIAVGTEHNKPGADLLTDTTVFLLQFADPVSLAAPMSDGESITAVDLLVRHLEDFSASVAIEYMRVMGDEIICASGLDGQSSNHPHLIADLALSVQERCTDLFAHSSTPVEFRIGIHTGPAMGSLVGKSHRLYNIWGEAVRFASLMAKTGITGGIQVSETTYRRLQSDFLFKARGRFYLPGVGEISTYLLTGRI